MCFCFVVIYLVRVWQLVYGNHGMNHSIAICKTDQVQRTPEIFSNKSRNFHKNWFSLSIRRDVNVLESLNIEHTNRTKYIFFRNLSSLATLTPKIINYYHQKWAEIEQKTLFSSLAIRWTILQNHMSSFRTFQNRMTHRNTSNTQKKN